jgi:glycosyltransferase involved in cell wall biosynthesis
MPNHDAVRYFVAKILPLLRERRSDVTFWVVGRNPPAWLTDLAAHIPGLQVTGTVDDIRPWLSKAAVYVVPLRIGGGTRIKIFEAMATALPVVSTTTGAEGLPVTHGKDIVLADDPRAMASEILGLLSTPSRRMALGVAARRLVEERYSWDTAAAAFSDILEHVRRETKGSAR